MISPRCFFLKRLPSGLVDHRGAAGSHPDLAVRSPPVEIASDDIAANLGHERRMIRKSVKRFSDKIMRQQKP
jgi:hypothetical protein